MNKLNDLIAEVESMVYEFRADSIAHGEIEIEDVLTELLAVLDEFKLSGNHKPVQRFFSGIDPAIRGDLYICRVWQALFRDLPLSYARI